MTAAVLPVRLAKEVGSLVPTFLAAVLVVGAGAAGGGMLVQPALFAFAIGAVVLGAQAVGHEYTHGTLGVLLAQPIDRRRLYAIKLGALAVALVPFTIAGWVLAVSRLDTVIAWTGLQPLALLVVAPLAFFVAPALTMLARGVLPGAVFTLAVPVVLLVAGDLTGVALHGLAAPDRIDAVRLTVFWWGLAAICAVGGIAGWRAFVRLEAIEGAAGGTPSRAVVVESTGTGAVRRHPLLMLAGKEFRIQQMTFAVAALYTAIVLTAVAVEWAAPGSASLWMPVVTPLYLGMIALLAGAVASAEERQLGTLEWQLLLPVGTGLQWAVKAGVAFASALALGIGLSAALARTFLGGTPELWQVVVLVMVLTSCGLYTSSLARSSVRALVSSLAMAAGLLMCLSLGMRFGWFVAVAVQEEVRVALQAVVPYDAATYRVLRSAVPVMMAGGLVAALTRFAFVNHRTVAHRRMTIAWQLAVIVVILATGIFLQHAIEVGSRPRLGISSR